MIKVKKATFPKIVIVTKRKILTRGGNASYLVHEYNKKSGRALSSYRLEGSRSSIIKDLRKHGYTVKSRKK